MNTSKPFLFLMRRSFSSASTQQKKTALYMWTRMSVGPKGTEMKQQLAIPKGVPTRVGAFDDLNI